MSNVLIMISPVDRISRRGQLFQKGFMLKKPRKGPSENLKQGEHNKTVYLRLQINTVQHTGTA